MMISEDDQNEVILQFDSIETCAEALYLAVVSTAFVTAEAPGLVSISPLWSELSDAHRGRWLKVAERLVALWGRR